MAICVPAWDAGSSSSRMRMLHDSGGWRPRQQAAAVYVHEVPSVRVNDLGETVEGQTPLT